MAAGLGSVHGGTLAELASVSNLWRAASLARRHKARRPDVESWRLEQEREISRLHRELKDGVWFPSGYRFFEIKEPKRRLIAAAPFADRVVHHALCLVTAPTIERRFIARSFSCQKGKGTTAARDCCRKLVNRNRYVLKCDVRKFFQSVDHTILLEKLRRVIPCDGVLEVARRILDGHATGRELPACAFPGDTLEDLLFRKRGLPIGNLTSQLWANLYLDAMDHWITEVERHGAYLRYTDDFLLFGNDKCRLWALKEGIVSQLTSLRLRLTEPKSRLLACREGVPFCGFLFAPRLRPRILGATKRRFARRCRSLLGKRQAPAVTRAMVSWRGFAAEANAAGLIKSGSLTRQPGSQCSV